jgi:hypothetical protein
MLFKIMLLLFLLVLSGTSVFAQSFGFGCLGLVGGFGGYTYQRYQPAGLNNYIMNFNESRIDSATNPMDNFGTAKGFRFGINFFRADFQGLILTTKGFYQSIVEKHDAEITSNQGSSLYKYELRFSNWGLGIDLGTSITKSFSWKVLEATLLFNKVTFTDNQNYPGGISFVREYQSESVLGYTVGTGFILSIVEGYISLEGLAGYTQMNISSVKLSDETELTIYENSTEPMINFIDNGGFIAVIQLNIGFPL